MPANIPSAIVTGRQQPGAGETLLMGLAQQLLGGLAQAGVQRVLPQQITPAQQQDFALRDRQIDVLERDQLAEENAATQKATLRASAIAAGRTELGKIGGEHAPTLISLFDFSTNAAAAGVDASTIGSIIKPMLPPDAATALGLQESRLKIIDAKNAQDADRFATSELTKQGIIPAGVSIIPGAAKTLLSVMEGREGKKIDWQQEGIDFIAGRIGESAGGTGGMSVVDGQLATTPPVTVEQATAEWREIIMRLAPEATRNNLLTQLDSSAFQRRLTVGLVKDEAAKIFMAGGTDELVRRNLAGSFTAEVIESIIRDARKTAPGLSKPTP